MTAPRNPRTGNPEYLVGKRVKTVAAFELRGGGEPLEAGTEGKVVLHRNGYFLIDFAVGPLTVGAKLRRIQFVVL